MTDMVVSRNCRDHYSLHAALTAELCLLVRGRHERAKGQTGDEREDNEEKKKEKKKKEGEEDTTTTTTSTTTSSLRPSATAVTRQQKQSPQSLSPYLQPIFAQETSRTTTTAGRSRSKSKSKRPWTTLEEDDRGGTDTKQNASGGGKTFPSVPRSYAASSVRLPPWPLRLNGRLDSEDEEEDEEWAVEEQSYGACLGGLPSSSSLSSVTALYSRLTRAVAQSIFSEPPPPPPPPQVGRGEKDSGKMVMKDNDMEQEQERDSGRDKTHEGRKTTAGRRAAKALLYEVGPLHVPDSTTHSPRPTTSARREARRLTRVFYRYLPAEARPSHSRAESSQSRSSRRSRRLSGATSSDTDRQETGVDGVRASALQWTLVEKVWSALEEKRRRASVVMGQSSAVELRRVYGLRPARSVHQARRRAASPHPLAAPSYADMNGHGEGCA